MKSFGISAKSIMLAAGLGVVALGTMAASGHLALLQKSPSKEAAGTTGPQPILVTAARVTTADFIETIVVTGSLVPREEILVGPEIEGLRVVEVLADEGDRVKKGQTLARLVSDTMEAQMAQNDASLAKAAAAMAQALSNIASADAKLVEARGAYNRGKPLTKSGYLSESVMEQRDSAAKSAEAALASAKDGLKVAAAEKAQVEAQRREMAWRRGRTEIASPADGIISRRIARIGGYASGAGDAMFRVIARGEVELEAEITESRVVKIKPGQSCDVTVAGGTTVPGKVRLVSPEIDKTTRLGKVRVFLGDNPALHVGGFARGVIETGRSRGLAVPAAAVLYTPEGASVQVVTDGTVRTRRVTLGLENGSLVEVREGLAEGDAVVAKSGTFLRDGDAVRTMSGDPRRTSDAGSAG